ncbi:MAG: hypothetical protein RJB38_1485 [Pseudomonadota bacterium]|jgi:diaminopimelate epimerase
MRFTKMHGLGNDFVILSEFDPGMGLALQALDSLQVQRLCDRHFGIGCDQLLWIGPARGSGAQARMEIWNPDGSRAQMCGNGIRAVALYLHDYGPSPLRGASQMSIETGAGVLALEIRGRQVRVDMGPPRFRARSPERLVSSVGEWLFWEVSMGNPHAVILVPQAQEVPLELWGPAIENHARFPERTNVEFVEVISRERLRVRVWERGTGATLACGTGACATAVAAISSGVAQSPVVIELPGGELFLEWNASDQSSVWMTGPAVEVFRGEMK